MFGGRGSAHEQREQRAGQVIGKSSESVQCAITGPCLRMRHRLTA